jgi:hypothetical protein
MNTQKQQGNDIDIINRLRGALSDTTVTPQQLMTVVQAMLSYVKKRFNALFEQLQRQQDGTNGQFATVRTEMQSLKATLTALDVALKTKKGKMELETELKEVWDQISYLVDTMPTPYDDTSLSERLASLQQSVEAITARLNEPEDDSEEDDLSREEVIELIKEYGPKKSTGSMPANMPPPDFGPFHESFTMDGIETTVTLSRGIGAQGTAVMVRYNGQTLDLGNQYTVDGIKVNLLFTPDAGTTISVTYWGG